MKKLAYILSGIILTILVVVLGFGLFVYIKLDSETLTEDVRNLLTEKLQTDVKLTECRINPWTQEMDVYGLNIQDRQHVDMLHIDTLEVRVDVLKLLSHKLKVYGLNLSGAHGTFYKERKDTAANYQFAIDALTFSKDNLESEENDDDEENDDSEENALKVDLKRCRIENTSVQWDVHSEERRNTDTWKEYDPNHIYIKDISLDMNLEGGGSPGNFVGELAHLYATEQNSLTQIRIEDVNFNGRQKKMSLSKAQFAYQDKQLSITGCNVSQNGTRDGNDITSLKIEKVSFKRDNHKPKKSTLNPKHGDFDPGHLDIEMSIDITASYLDADSMSMRINSLKGVDHESGLQVSEFSANVTNSPERCYFTDVKLVDQHTSVNASLVNLFFPSKLHPNSFYVKADNVSAHVVLQDISRPFTPALRNFTTPLELSTDFTGNEKGLNFSRIHVYTQDGRLGIDANGFITFGNKALMKKTELGFNILSMFARRGIKGQILEHFANLSPAFVTSLTKIGDIQFQGKLSLPYRQQIITGVLTTAIGNITADIHLRSDSLKHHYMKGTASSKSVDLAALTGNENLGPVAFTSSFDFLFPPKVNGHTQKGTLPIGKLSGTALSASYKILTLHNIDFSINSDGHFVNGTISNDGKIMNVSADFSFKGSDIKNTLEVKPHIRAGKLLRNSFIGKLFRKKSQR